MMDSGLQIFDCRFWVKNNKRQAIQIIVTNLIPTSTSNETMVSLEQSLNDQLNKKTGEKR